MHDLVVKGDDLVLATHGRSLWVLDNIQPLRDYDAKVASEAAYLFAPADAIRWRYGSGAWGTNGGLPNPPHGAVIDYSLKDEDKNEIKIEILDAEGQVVRTLSSTAEQPMGSDDNEDPNDFKDKALPRAAGVQRAVWNLRTRAPTRSRVAKSTRVIPPRARESRQGSTPSA